MRLADAWLNLYDVYDLDWTVTGLRPGDRFLCPSSPAWGHGLWHGTLAPLAAWGQVAVRPTGSPAASAANASITAKPLTVTGITANNKVYDNTTAATLNSGSAALVGVVGSEAVTLDVSSAVGAFSDKTVGTGKTSVAAAFVQAACSRGERCLYFAFEESPRQIIRNMRSIGSSVLPRAASWRVRITTPTRASSARSRRRRFCRSSAIGPLRWSFAC